MSKNEQANPHLFASLKEKRKQGELSSKRLRQCMPLLALFVLHPSPAAIAQQPTSPPPVHLTAEQDHQRTMGLLHITTLRPGRAGNPDSPNPANYDESKANPFPDLPADALGLTPGVCLHISLHSLSWRNI